MLNSVFTSLFNEITNNIEFDVDWKNNTGYLDGVTYEMIVEPGKLAKTTDDFGRRVILIGTDVGTCAIFERYTDNNDKENIVVVSNVPRSLTSLFPQGSMSTEAFERLLGITTIRNIGVTIQYIISDTAKMNGFLVSPFTKQKSNLNALSA